MGSNVWQSEPYRKSYEWLLESLTPRLARAKAFSSNSITNSERRTLAVIGDNKKHNEELLTYLERKQENFPCLVDIVSAMGCKEEADRLGRALLPPSPQSPQHLACASAAQSYPQPGLPVHPTLAKQSQPGLQGRQPQLEPQSQSKPPPQPEPHLPTEPRLLPDEPLEPEAKRPPSTVYPLDALATGEAALVTYSLENGVRNSPLDFVASHSPSDSGMESDEDTRTVKWMKMRIFREKHSFFSLHECVYTLEETYKVKVKPDCMRENASLREQLLEYGDADKKESYDREMATVRIVVGVDKHTTGGERQKLAQNVKKSLKEECGIELVIVDIGDGSIVIYALIPVEDLIRLYTISTYQPGVLAGLGLLEISTLGRSTTISFRPSPCGPAEEPIHPSLSLLIGDTVPGKAHVITSEPNMHHAVRALVANLPVDGEALPKVIKWLEKHRNDVFNTPSLFAMNPERVQPSSGVSSISTTSPSISGEVRDSTTKKSVVVSLSDSRLTSTEPENLVSELAEQRSAITDGDTRALQLYNLHPLTLAPLMPVISATVIDTACMAAQQAKPDESSRMKPRDVCESIYSQYKDDLETLIVYKEVHNQLVANSVISISRDLEILKGEHRNQGKELFKVLLNKGPVAFWHFIHALEEITQIEVHKEMAMTLRAAAEREHLREQEDCK